MKILFTGGGTGGHFYPVIAVAEEVKRICTEQKIVAPELYFMSDKPYNERALSDNGLKFVPVQAGKIRRYFSLMNFFDVFKTIFGSIRAIFTLFSIYPDVVFGKGGYASFPGLLAARLLRIPVVIHESDSHPGRVTLWAGKFAKRIAVSYPEAAKYFPPEKTAVVGNPIRREVLFPAKAGAHEFLGLDKNIPIIFVVGGSQGAVRINDVVLDILPQLLADYQVIHQVGKNNYDDLKNRASFLTENNPHKNRYKLFDYLNDVAMRMTAGAANLVISRAGSAIFEIANWGIPAIIIPIPEEISHDQRTNAFTYARSGGAVVIEEKNLTPSILLSETKRILDDPELQKQMKTGAQSFAKPEAGEKIAEEIIRLALEHEE
ncbi:MAG TPA: undecaprenyldiphospho-muramoylpentapeptide beta-N-acetylglucosaminyltransferase [Candidatus Paceibacterota bacterium]|nr:undecaprenyldiphospho-muramoylpentapeptide beta-N-acetylglucosaminyltransferase [Candidatus Paceibacterota bacterium]HQI25913.1 undecaprenyldiphospho-muramoylpentapeptide beta-N-acetylglucosaminyltransferase [Candidatus Paceibacterota bacterium]HQJ83882.1 undecaprenyldiphospho-muramoylpentapeptide beta-N-acetylglucosaminyltransferase [Candidatus Paceibacterota bacterium]